MEVYQVRVFLEVARHLSFTEAADALNLTQPAVSAKIKSLESELGAPLFYRLGRKIQLTEVGQFLLEEGVKLIQIENQLLQKIQEIKKGKSGNLRIGATGAIASGWLPEVIFTYRKAYTGIQTQCLVFDRPEDLYRAISSNQIDLGLCDIGFSEFSELTTTVVDQIQYVALVSATHPLASQPWLSLQTLQREPWVVLPVESPSRLVLEARLSELGLSLAEFPQLETVDTPSLLRTYLLQGHYLGFASNLEFQAECEAGLLVPIPLQEFALAGNVFLITPKGVSQTDAAYASTSRRSPTLSPVQKLIQLLQDMKGAFREELPSVPPAGTRLRSPEFTLRPTNPHRPDTLTLSIGIQNGTIPSITAGLIIQRLGLLEHFLPRDGRYSSTRYQIRWQDYLTGAPIVEGLDHGQLNIGILGDYPLLLSGLRCTQKKSNPTRLVSFISINPDGSCNAVIVPHDSPVQSLEDLKGRVLAVPFKSSAHGMVMRSLNTANLLDQVTLTSLEQANPHDLFHLPEQSVDGYAHFAPFHDVACRRGAFRYLSGQAETLPAFYGVAVSSELADHHPEVVMAYLKALVAAQTWYDSTPSAPFLVSQWTNLDTEIITQILSSSQQRNSTGRFFSDMTIRPDWLQVHIEKLSQIPGNGGLQQIDLSQWIQDEFLLGLRN